MTLTDAICEDLRTAARFLLDDGYSLSESDAARVGMALCELAGMMRAEGLRIDLGKEPSE